ncbi:hypothetical protein ACLKA6_019627 [Drosophila palustris]
MSMDLSIVGVPLRVGVKYAPRLTMRRIYNKKYFRDERYRHEVANHYRDFKMQQTTQQLNRQLSLGRRKQRVRCVRLRPLVATPEVATSLAAASFRGQLPTHVHYFPRFGDTYTPRGRQTICSRAPPDDTYNDTLRRIKSAQSCEQLKALVERHLDRQCGNNGQSNNKCIQRDPESVRSSSSVSVGSSNNYEQHVLDINTLKLENLQRQQQRRIDLYTYLQLASGYYERGLHANIKYLQSIGQRNAIKKQQQQQQEQQRQRLRQRRYSLEAWPQQQSVEQQPTTHRLPGRLSALLKSLRQRQRCQTVHSNSNNSSECSKAAIRVHIAPVQQQQRATTTTIDASGSSMCDSNSNSNNNNNINSGSSSSSNDVNIAATTAEEIDQHRKLYAIIDNLSQLSLCDNKSENRLPLITLTDYTQQVALYGANFDIIAVAAAGNCQMQIPNEAKPPT